MILFRYGETGKLQKDYFLPKFSKCVFISSSVAENDKIVLEWLFRIVSEWQIRIVPDWQFKAVPERQKREGFERLKDILF